MVLNHSANFFQLGVLYLVRRALRIFLIKNNGFEPLCYIPKREILSAWRPLLGKTCFKNFSFWFAPLKVSIILLLPCFIQERGFNTLESNDRTMR